MSDAMRAALEVLTAAYGEYAGHADGAGTFQPRVVQRLVEAVFDVVEARALTPAGPEEPGLDVERLAWAMHLVEQHGKREAPDATPCSHDRATSAWPNGPAIAAEYELLRR